MPRRRVSLPARFTAAVLLALYACAGGTAPPATDPVPARTPGPPNSNGPSPNLPPVIREPIVPPALAAARGWLPLAATGVPAFLAEHPTWDGRGVLIGILDSGIDPGVAGLQWTSLGSPKLLDLRDFSGEGRVSLSTVVPTGDSIRVAGHTLGGLGRIRGLATAGPWYAGLLPERSLGEPGAMDLNDNGTDGDTLVVVVVRATDGWVLLADTDGDGSLGNERPVHDYLVARETFGWRRAGEPPPTTIAVNFADSPLGPLLDLCFDNSAHGTHVAGIAAGQNIGGVSGFNGVAPGAQLLGLKISRNDFGGITTTGSMLRAMDYGIRFARSRGMPLVFNMSFGVGNEREGAARIDRMIDSVLAANPEVIFVTSAGNDGPGLSTMGFPGSARRAITVGSTDPWALSVEAVRGGSPAPDVLAYYSSRGGELAKPDVVAPGTAFSTVPRWNMGDEFKGGTSMASPHVAGLAALLVSGALEARRIVHAEDVRRALVGSATAVAGQTVLDQGAGVPFLDRAWPILGGPAPPAAFDVNVLDGRGVSAAYRVAPAPADSLVRFVITRDGPGGAVGVTLTSSAPWLRAPAALRLAGPSDTITLVQHPPPEPGTWIAEVRATTPGITGPMFTLISTVIVPVASRVAPVRAGGVLTRGTSRRVVFAADSGRPFRLRVGARSPRDKVVAALFQPGGAPISEKNGISGGADTAAAVFDVDGRDARSGYYEAVAVAGPAPADAVIEVDHSPVTIELAEPQGDSAVVTVRSTANSVVAGRLRLGVLGAEQTVELDGTGGADGSWRVHLPPWVRRVVADLQLDPVQWPRFTDFGFTLLGADDRVIAKQPANYQRTRLEAALPSRRGEEDFSLVLSPGFAEPGSTEPWTGRVTLRLYAEAAEALATVPGGEFSLPPGAFLTFAIPVADSPWELPPGFTPLILIVEESGGIIWHWEFPLNSPGSVR